MASSSSRNTHLEDRLRLLYKTASWRLFAAGYKAEAWVTTMYFAQVLDVDVDTLSNVQSQPKLLPDDSNLEWCEAELKYDVNMEETNLTLPKSGKISEAADAFAEAGDLLKRSGRDADAKKLYQWCDTLWEISHNLWVEEEVKMHRAARDALSVAGMSIDSLE